MKGPLRRFEKGLERIFEDSFARAFKGGVHPLEIARRLTREIDDGRVLGVGGVLAPNHYQVRLSARDHERLSGAMAGLAAELESLVIAYTNRRDFRLITRPRVEFQRDDSLREGEFQIAARLDEPAPPRALRPAAAEGGRGGVPEGEAMLTVMEEGSAERTISLHLEKTRVGRAEENDLVLADPRASRFHAEIERTPAGYIVRDLGSTNGTMVQGRRVRERLLRDGDALNMGGTALRFRLAGERP